MPLMKFRLKKSRQYNLSSKALYVISVTLLDNNDIECTLSSDSTGKECLENICQRLSLQQPDFFGLRYVAKSGHSSQGSGRHGHGMANMRWIELEKPVKKQLEKYSRDQKLYLGVMYYITDIHLLQCENTRYQYFLQLKQDVLKGKLTCNFEQAIMLAAYSLQASFGDHDPERHNLEYFREMQLHLPESIMAKDPDQLFQILEQVMERYIGLQSLSPTLAEVYYIVEAQRLEGYGVEFFPARSCSGDQDVLVGSSLLGIVIRHFSPHPALHYYRWSDISNLVNQKKSFTIELQSSSPSMESLSFTFDGHEIAKYVWKLCVIQHTFFKRQQLLLGITDGAGDGEQGLQVPDIQSSSQATTSSSSCGAVLPDIHPMASGNPPTALHQLHPHPTPLNLSFPPQMSVHGLSPGQQPLQNLAAYEDPHFHHGHRLSSKPSHHLSSPNLGAMDGGAIPQYRQAPDYQTAVSLKYGGPEVEPDRNSNYSSQPNLVSSGLRGPPQPQSRRSDHLLTLNYSSPNLNQDALSGSPVGVVQAPRRPPPSYEAAVSKLQSTSYPDLPSHGNVAGGSPANTSADPPTTGLSNHTDTVLGGSSPDLAQKMAASAATPTPGPPQVYRVSTTDGTDGHSSEPIYENIPPRRPPPSYSLALMQAKGLSGKPTPATANSPAPPPQQIPSTSRQSTTAAPTASSTPQTKPLHPPLSTQTSTYASVKDVRAIALIERIGLPSLVTEYEAVPREKPGASTSVASQPENAAKNRFRDVLPYDENRVTLTPTADNKTGYVNASRITMTVANLTRFFVAAQAPLANTITHFWQAVWEQDVRVVVMLNTIAANNSPQQYWPLRDGERLHFGDFTVHRQCSSPGSSYVTSRLQLTYRKKTRALWHLQYTDWADHGCPEDVQGFVSFLEEMDLLRRQSLSELSLSSSKNPPVLVHCSAGVGRTGVTILCDILLYCLDHNISVDVQRNLALLREQRANMVQTVLQYRFVYEVLIQYLQQSRLI